MQKKRILLVFLVLALLVALPSATLANKRIYKAQLRTANVVPPPAGYNATGNFLMRYWQPGIILVDVTSTNLSGTPIGVHMHAPAPAGTNAPIIISLCGVPAPAMVPDCPPLSATGFFGLSGEITPGLLQASGITGAQLLDLLDQGLVYVQVHTPANPAGEMRGQVSLSQIVLP